ncbi:Uma2 family endonuclease [Nocardia sp. NBC_00508]|uniref:Uma2 family endonuclease n=1 Tax=Nocardia sp. NBC_00508 TaxID=2975992 RepID=UPI002E806F04|nr:Uma2 family endonuclease [Nocardia sp. NBC_00508]WUD68020.1 Uma2 family endonuclease [Nocardia sp. NBC_00508]
MTIVQHDHDIPVSEFENIARAVERESDSVRLEYIGGRMGFKFIPDGDHSRILNWLLMIFVPFSPQLFLHVTGQGLKVDPYRQGRARPDGVLAPLDAFVGYGEWAPADKVSMMVEVTSRDSDTNQRDRVEKPTAYARTAIPIYLLIDRESAEIVVHSEPTPGSGRYRRVRRFAFGHPVPLPAPIDITLDTVSLQDWVD